MNDVPLTPPPLTPPPAPAPQAQPPPAPGVNPPQFSSSHPWLLLVATLLIAIPSSFFIGWQIGEKVKDSEIRAKESERATQAQFAIEAERRRENAETHSRDADRRYSELIDHNKSLQDTAASLTSQIGQLAEQVRSKESEITRLNSRRAKLILRGNSHTITRYAPVDLADLSIISSDQDPNWKFEKSDRVQGASLIYE